MTVLYVLGYLLVAFIFGVVVNVTELNTKEEDVFIWSILWPFMLTLMVVFVVLALPFQFAVDRTTKFIKKRLENKAT